MKFGLEATATLRELAAHGEDVRSLSGAEAERLAPLVASATRRVLEIPRNLEAVASQLCHMDSATAERRENLRKAGVTGEDLERLVAEGADERASRRAALNTERTALHAEQESLARFLETRDEQHLPAGFTVSEPIKASAPYRHYRKCSRFIASPRNRSMAGRRSGKYKTDYQSGIAASIHSESLIDCPAASSGEQHATYIQ
ncbi:hypothetical protein [Azonexus hydrophilus]